MQSQDPVIERPQVRTAVLLAAGVGARLAPLTNSRPKCLVPVGDTPILERLVRALDGYGIDRLVIVVGYRAEMIRAYLGESFGGIAVEYVVSPLFETTNTLYSLWLARHLIDEPLLVIESDVVFDEPLLEPLLRPDRIAVSRQLPWMNSSTVTLDAGGIVSAYFSQPPGVYDDCIPADRFLTVNICSLGRDAWREVGVRLDRHVAAGHTCSFHDIVFNEMVADGSMVLSAVIFPADRWYEIDTPADRDAAELVLSSPPRSARGAQHRKAPSGGATR